MQNKKAVRIKDEVFALNDPQNGAIQWNQDHITVKCVGSKRLVTH